MIKLKKNDVILYDDADYDDADEWNDYINDYAYMMDQLREYDQKCNTYGYVLIANVGRWNGRYTAYKYFKTLEEAVIFTLEDINRIYLDAYNLNIEAIHHDGNNYYTIKAIKNNLKEIQLNNLYDALDYGLMNENKVKIYLKSIKKDLKKYFI